MSDRLMPLQVQPSLSIIKKPWPKTNQELGPSYWPLPTLTAQHLGRYPLSGSPSPGPLPTLR